jgi:hypothetical protein
MTYLTGYASFAAIVGLIGAAGTTFAAIDVTKNPGCGVYKATAQERIERNAEIAELLFQGYVEGPKRQYLYNWFDYGCVASDATTFNWLMKPLEAPRRIGLPSDIKNPGEGMRTEMKVHWKVMPDYGGIPGTFRVFAWDGGAQLRMVYGGHTADGQFHSTWEVDTILINDQGRITHWEFWNDAKGSDDVIYTVLGKHLIGMTMQEYGRALKEKLNEK